MSMQNPRCLSITWASSPIIARRWNATRSPRSDALLRHVAIACVSLLCAGAAWSDEWFTVHGYPNQPEDDLVEVNPSAVDMSGQQVVSLRVSRKNVRTSFQGHRYRSYFGTAVIDCTARRGWYLANRYYLQPMWGGPMTAEESFRPGEAPVAFKDMPGDAARKIVQAACSRKARS